MYNIEQFEHLNGNEIAIIGLHGRFPGAGNVDEFWHNLRDGVESVSFFTVEGQEIAIAEAPAQSAAANKQLKAHALIKDIEWFDAAFFDYSPREAEIIDPQQRLFLECAW